MILYSALYNDFHPFDKLFPKWDCQIVGLDSTLDTDSVLVIWGGGDIHPSFYNRPNMGSHVGKAPSLRDLQEWGLMVHAIEKKIPIIGVCRGAQLGCAAAGGILIQDVRGHTRDHMIETYDDKKMITSSLHHQMMFPWNTKHQLLAWSLEPRSQGNYVGLTDVELSHKLVDQFEPEIIWFSDIKCLAIQGHPEFMHESNVFNLYVKFLIEKFILS